MVESYKNNVLILNKIIRLALTFKLIHGIVSKYNISLPAKEIIETEALRNLYTEEFLNILVVNEFFKTAKQRGISEFFTNAISYEMGKGVLDDSTLKDYLKAVDKHLPDELCNTIDEIEDIHIIDVALINKTEEYCKFYSKYNPILKEVNYGTDIAIVEILYPLIKNYEQFPEEIKYFQ
jgi:hypothetical protein